MFKRTIKIISTIIGLSFGLTVGPEIWAWLSLDHPWLVNAYVNASIFALIFYFLGLFLAPYINSGIKQLLEVVNRQSTSTIIFGTIGTLAGLLIGYLISLPFANLEIPFVSGAIPLIFSIVLAIVGFQTAVNRKDEWVQFFKINEDKDNLEGEVIPKHQDKIFYEYKILDTSVIIDGRIADIAKTGFLEGVLLIPNFVLRELQYIADSSDSLKRTKGRRGLDILNEMQKEDGITIEFYDGDFDDETEVDSKLIRLAKLLDGAVVTNDFNLNKVSEFQNVKVFNINELANALKPSLVPGELLNVLIIKAGTERQQGVAYLEDGTMIVVEDGQHFMNEWLSVVVTSALQTNAGRMIFARPAHSQEQIDKPRD